MDISSVNFLQLTFFLLTLCSLVAHFSDRFLPSSAVQVLRYGRANMSKVKPWFVKVIEVPKSWFAHFYLFSVIMQGLLVYSVVSTYVNQLHEESGVTLLKKIIFFLGGTNRKTTVSASTTVLVVLLFWIQVIRRLYETVYVSVYSDTKMNIIHYAIAFIHYSCSMLSIIAHSPGFSTDPIEHQTSLNGITAYQILAVLLFLYGSVEQYKAHLGYANLRKGKDKNVVTYGHKIPTGGLFDLVSCPNYFAEIVIYVSICCMFGLQNSTWNCVTIWVIANQIVSAVMNHNWYLEKFPEYPKARKAIIPFLY